MKHLRSAVLNIRIIYDIHIIFMTNTNITAINLADAEEDLASGWKN